MSLFQSLAPQTCLQCGTQRSFLILENRVECRVCGYISEAHPATAPAAKPAISPPTHLRASYRTTHIGEIDRWAHAAFDTGQDYIRQEKWAEAVKAFERAIDNQPDFVDPHLWIAQIVSDPAVKRDHLENVLASQPNHLEAMRELMILDGRLSAQAALMTEFTEPQIVQAGGAVGVETQNIRCPRCDSSDLGTDDVTGLVICNSCGYAQPDTNKQPVGEGNLTIALLEHRAQPVQWVVGEHWLECDSCGAKRTIPTQKLSNRCPFCGSTHVIERDVLGSFQQPDSLIPFRIRPQKAEALVQKRLGGFGERLQSLWDNNQIKETTIEAVFLPYWVFDTIIEVRRTIIHDARSWENQRMLNFQPYQTETLADMMNNVAVCAVDSPPRLLTGRLGDYDMERTIPYQAKLLTKVQTELYSMNFDKASLEARAMVSEVMRSKYQIPQSGAQVNIFSSIKQMSFQLVLMPVWIITLYEADGDIRTALVNGQSGRVAIGKPHKNPERHR